MKTKKDYQIAQDESWKREKERQEKREALEQRLLRALPDDLPFENIFGHELWGTIGRVKIVDQSLASIVSLLEALPPVEMVHVRAGCVSFQPECTYIPQERDEYDLIFPAILSIDKIAHYPSEVKVEWYCQREGELFSVDAYLAHSHPISLIYKKGTRYTPSSWELGTHPDMWVDRRIRWWTPEGSAPRYTLFWNRITDESMQGERASDVWKSEIFPYLNRTNT